MIFAKNQNHVQKRGRDCDLCGWWRDTREFDACEWCAQDAEDHSTIPDRQVGTDVKNFILTVPLV